jgi:hypothetical protein
VGHVPWQKKYLKTPPGTTPAEHKKLVLRAKEAATPAVLCKGLPRAFFDYMVAVRALKPEATPNYVSLRNLFLDTTRNLGQRYDWHFDWDDDPVYVAQRHADGAKYPTHLLRQELLQSRPNIPFGPPSPTLSFPMDNVHSNSAPLEKHEEGARFHGTNSSQLMENSLFSPLPTEREAFSQDEWMKSTSLPPPAALSLVLPTQSVMDANFAFSDQLPLIPRYTNHSNMTSFFTNRPQLVSPSNPRQLELLDPPRYNFIPPAQSPQHVTIPNESNLSAQFPAWHAQHSTQGG